MFFAVTVDTTLWIELLYISNIIIMFNCVVSFHIDVDDHDHDDDDDDDDELFLCTRKSGHLISEFSVLLLLFCLHGSMKSHGKNTATAEAAFQAA